MSKGRQGIKILGLSLMAALGLMAFTAAAAQATGVFKVNGADWNTGTETVAGTGGKGKLLSLINLECQKGTGSGAIEPAGMAKAVILFEECTSPNNAQCVVYPTEADRTAETHKGHITAMGLGTLALMEVKQHYLVAEGLPIENAKKEIIGHEPFTTVYFGNLVGKKTCTLTGAGKEITGTVALELPKALEELVNQSANPFSIVNAKEEIIAGKQAELEALLGVHLAFGGNTAWLDGGAITNLHLTGANEGKTWGAR